MSTIVTRAGKGSALTYAEVDSNFTNLNTDKYQSGSTASLASLTLATALPVTSGGTGTGTAFTPGSVVFAGASGVYSQDNTNLFWDDTNKLLGIGTATPQVALDVLGVGSFSALVYSPLIIGGTSPTSSLQLRSTLGAGTTGSDIVFQVGSNGATEVMRMLNNGKVGIGTTAPTEALDLFTGKLTGCASDLSNRVKLNLGGGGPGGGFAAADFEYPAGGKFRAIEVPVVSVGVNDIFFQAYPPAIDGYGYFETWAGAGTIIGTGNATPIIFRPNRAEVMRLTSAGNLGIGTTNPTQKLDVFGAIAVGGTTVIDATRTLFNVGLGSNMTVSQGAAIRFAHSLQTDVNDGTIGAGSFASGLNIVGVQTSAGTGRQIRFYGSLLGASSIATPLLTNAGTLALTATGANIVTLSTNGAERMRITSTGNVGIGTASPAQVLDVVGGIRSTSGANNINLRHDGTNGSIINNGGSFLLYAQGAQAMILHTNSVERMRITSTGEVLIGATAAINSSKLLVAGVTGSNPAVIQGSAAASAALAFYNNAATTNRFMIGQGYVTASDNIAFIQNYVSAALVFGTNSAERMRVDAAGNVGIGTTTNLSTLTVNGSFASKSPSTVNAATYTVAATDGSLRFTTTNCTVTLPAAASFPGRILYLNTITANSVTSAAANVIPLGSNTAGTAILAATAGKFAMIQSDGTNWITMMSN